MKKLSLLFVFVPFLMASTCEKEDPQIVCTDEFVYGLHVTVLDASSGLPMASGVQVRATDGNFNETLFNLIGRDSTFYGAGERMGRYSITASKEGYQTTSISPVSVTANVCHVNPQYVTIQLQPE